MTTLQLDFNLDNELPIHKLNLEVPIRRRHKTTHSMKNSVFYLAALHMVVVSTYGKVHEIVNNKPQLQERRKTQFISYKFIFKSFTFSHFQITNRVQSRIILNRMAWRRNCATSKKWRNAYSNSENTKKANNSFWCSHVDWAITNWLQLPWTTTFVLSVVVCRFYVRLCVRIKSGCSWYRFVSFEISLSAQSGVSS